MSNPIPEKPKERIVLLKIDQIRTDLGTQPRAQLNLEWVKELTDIAKREGEEGVWPLPQPIVFWDGEKYILASGFHRLSARRAAGQKTVEAKVRDGDIRDAILFAASTNSDHGLQRTPADMRHVARILLLDPEWGKWSNQAIARWCKVRPHYVSEERNQIKEEKRLAREKEAARKAAEAEKNNPKPPEPPKSAPATTDSDSDKAQSENNGDAGGETRTYTTRHGTTATMRVGNIGSNKRAQKVKPVIRETKEKYIAKALTQLKRSIPKAVKQAKKAGWTWEKFAEENRKIWDEIPVVDG